MSATRDAVCSLAGIVSSGCASNCNSSEIAAPIRARPKSRPKIGFIAHPNLLRFRRNFADKLLDPFGFVSVTNQQRVLRPHDNQVSNSEERDRRAVFLEHDVIARIERGNDAIRGILLKRSRKPFSKFPGARTWEMKSASSGA